MADRDLSDLLEVPGRLIRTPTDLAAAFPHGGTELGEVKAVIVEPNERNEDVPMPEYGGEAGDVVYLGASYVLTCELRGYDNDAVEKVIASSAVGASSGERVVEYPGTKLIGSLRSADAFILMFSPDDTINHHAVLFYNAIGMLAEAWQETLDLDDEATIGVSFKAIREAGAAGRAVAHGLIEDLTL